MDTLQFSILLTTILKPFRKAVVQYSCDEDVIRFFVEFSCWAIFRCVGEECRMIYVDKRNDSPLQNYCKDMMVGNEKVLSLMQNYVDYESWKNSEPKREWVGSS